MEEFLKRSKPSSSNNVVELSDSEDLASSKHDDDDDNIFETGSKRYVNYPNQVINLIIF